MSLKKKIANGEKLTGCWTAMCSPIAARIMAEAGYDTAMIDLEHSPSDYLNGVSLMQSIESGGAAPIVRSSSADAVDIKRTLDMGPAGIMVPGIRNAAHAREVVAHCRYAPAGDRGAAPGYIRATAYQTERIEDYLRYMEEDFLLIVQVESAEAVADVEAIATTDGVDMVFVGPADLSASLGALGQFHSQEFIDAMADIEAATLSAGKALGSIVFDKWPPKRLYQSGYQLVLSGADTMLLALAAADDQRDLDEAR